MEAVRLTKDPADDYAPSFSPDGRSIAFRSDRDGGGIYVISARGGEARRIAQLGRRPKFSPDGKWIAYWIGTDPGDISSLFLAPGTGKIYIVPSAGGASQGIRPEFAAAGYPVWTPDGGHLLFLGNRDPNVQHEGSVDWWVTPLDESESVVETGANAAFRTLGLSSVSQAPEGWTADAAEVLMSAKLADTINVWRLPISTRTWKVDGVPRRVTFGTAMDVQPSVAGNYVAFSSLSGNVDVWSLPIDANQAKPTGSLQRLTRDAFSHSYPAVSPDGKKIAYSSRRSGSRDIWLKDLGTGQEIAVSSSQVAAVNPNFSPDGDALAFQAKEKGRFVSFVVSLGGGHLNRLCEDCSDYGWSSDEKRLVLVGTFPARISVLDLASRRRTALLNDPEHLLWNARFSPDDRWVSFNATAPGRSQIFVAPVRSGIVPESEWISVANGVWDDKPRWSPDGKMIYFVSERDHFRCIWAQPLDARKHPVGPPIPIFHAHEARRSLANLGSGTLSISVARDKIVFNMSEQTGNVWMARVDDQR